MRYELSSDRLPAHALVDLVELDLEVDTGHDDLDESRTGRLMAVAALILYGIWFALTIGLRTLIQLRRTGNTGFKGLGGRPGSVEWIAGVLFTVALLVGVAGPVAALAGLEPLGPLDAAWLPWVGLMVAGFGVVLTLLAQLSMGDSWRIGVEQQRNKPRWSRAAPSPSSGTPSSRPCSSRQSA